MSTAGEQPEQTTAAPNTASVSQQLVDLVTQAGTSGELGRVVVHDGLTVTAYVREGRMCVLLTRDKWEPPQSDGRSVAHDLNWKEFTLKRVAIPLKVGGLLLQEKSAGLLPGARQALIKALLSLRPSWVTDDSREIRAKYLASADDDELLDDYRLHLRNVAAIYDPEVRAAQQADLMTDAQLQMWGLMDVLRPTDVHAVT